MRKPWRRWSVATRCLPWMAGRWEQGHPRQRHAPIPGQASPRASDQGLLIAQVARSGSKSGQARGRTRVEDTRGGIPCWVGWTDGWLPGLAIFEHVTGIRDRNASVGSPSATRPWATSAKPPEPHMGPALRLPPQLAERADDLAPFKARDDGRVAGSSIHAGFSATRASRCTSRQRTAAGSTWSSAGLPS